MLIINRSQFQSVSIGDATVTFLGMQGRYARLGIDAPSDIPITRPDAVNQTPKDRPTRPSMGETLEQLVAKIDSLERTIKAMHRCQCDLAENESREST